MAQVLNSSKKLKQAQLNFTPKNTKPKLRIKLKEQGLDDASADDDTLSMTNSTKCVVSQKSSDAEENIQCPEVSTSTLYSDAEKAENDVKKDPVVIDLLDDDSCDVHNNFTVVAKVIPPDVSSNIDDAIDDVIARGLTEREVMIENRDALRGNKKRRRSKSPNPVQPDQLTAPATLPQNCPVVVTDCLNLPVPTIIVSSPRSTEQIAKKPRCSVVDLLTKKGAEAKHDVQPKSESMKPEQDKGPSQRKKRRSISPSKTSENTENKMDIDENEALIINSDKIEDSASVITQEKFETSDLAIPLNDESCVDMDTSCEDQNISLVDHSAKETSPNKDTSPATKRAKRQRKITPAMQKRMEEKAKEREEKQKQKEIREMEKLEAKKKKEEERLEKEEERRKKKEEEDRIKQEKLRIKQEEMEKRKMELEAKQLEKERKEEEKRREREKKEMERKMKEEEKQKILLEKQMAEEGKKKKEERRASNFMGFFTSPARAAAATKPVEKKVGSFVPFQLKESMSLAPLQRRKVSDSDRTALLDCLTNQNSPVNYLEEIKSEIYRSRNITSKTKRREKRFLSLTEDGLEVVGGGEDSRSSCMINIRAKLMQFCENNRPPYYGTYRKRSKYIRPRRPFVKDVDLLDYEVDSDDEWEDPADGEDIANSDGEEDGDKDEDKEDDEGDGFFVPHGYLSDDEGIDQDVDEEKGEEEISDQKLKMKQKEFENSFKRKVQVLKIKKIGCVWPSNETEFQKQDLDFLKTFKMHFITPTPIDLDETPITTSANTDQPNKPKTIKNAVPDEAMGDLIRLLHGSPHSSQRLVKEFQVYWEMKNAGSLLPHHGPLALTTLDSSDCSADLSEVGASLPSAPSPPKPPHSCLLSSSPPSQNASPAQSRVAGVDLLSQANKGEFWISKSQLTKKIKEIGAYGRKETLNRSCWFVLDAVFKKYSLDPRDYPVPSRWGYITQVADISLVELPSAPSTPSVINPDIQQMKIAKFALKVSAENLLEKSIEKSKLEKDRMETDVASKLLKFTTKVSADELLETSRQRLQQQESTKRRIELITIPPNIQDEENIDPDSSQPLPSFGVPSHSAFKTFFKITDVQSAKTSALSPCKKMNENTNQPAPNQLAEHQPPENMVVDE